MLRRTLRKSPNSQEINGHAISSAHKITYSRLASCTYNFDLIYLLNLETELIILGRLNVILIRLELEKLLPLEKYF
jgi:hypothetical protein